METESLRREVTQLTTESDKGVGSALYMALIRSLIRITFHKFLLTFTFMLSYERNINFSRSNFSFGNE
jgi:hypothetical protein